MSDKTYVVARRYPRGGIVCVAKEYVDALPKDLLANSLSEVRATSKRAAITRYRTRLVRDERRSSSRSINAPKREPIPTQATPSNGRVLAQRERRRYLKGLTVYGSLEIHVHCACGEVLLLDGDERRICTNCNRIYCSEIRVWERR